MAHIGDDWTCNVLGARQVNATTVWIANGRRPPPSEQHPKILIAADITEAAHHIADIARRRTP
jgi:FMN phosphatase YigB (HAD superfamily)